MRKSLLVPIMILTMAGSLWSPAGAGSLRCSRWDPSYAPDSPAAGAEQAPDLPVMAVTPQATRRKPLVLEFEQKPALWVPWPAYEPVVEDDHFFNFQMMSTRSDLVVHTRLTWTRPGSDLDIWQFGSSGGFVSASEAFNVPGLDDAFFTLFPNPDSSYGLTFEHLAVRISPCQGFTIETFASRSPGDSVRLEVWLERAKRS